MGYCEILASASSIAARIVSSLVINLTTAYTRSFHIRKVMRRTIYIERNYESENGQNIPDKRVARQVLVHRTGRVPKKRNGIRHRHPQCM